MTSRVPRRLRHLRHRRGWLGLPTLLGILALLACSPAAPPQADDAPPEAASRSDGARDTDSGLSETMPLTAANLRGHEALYNEGWFIVTSTRNALHYAYEHSVVTSGEALAAAQRDVSGHSAAFRAGVGAGVQGAGETAAAFRAQGTRFSSLIESRAHGAGTAQVDYGLAALGRSWDFVTGSVYFDARSGKDWAALRATWPDYYGNLQRDFGNIAELNARIAGTFATEIEADWEGAFEEAATAFRAEYERSGQRSNSLTALGDLLHGYLQAFYQGLARPTARSLVIGASAGAQAGSYVFTPVAGTLTLVGRTVQASGLSVYHATRGTVAVFSPSVEAGLLTGLGLLSLGSGAATHLGGEALGLANQVAFTGAGLAAAGVAGAGRTGAETGRYVALVTYDVARGATEVAINQARSGVVLGYNALTAIPAHLLIGVPSAAIFLAYEGPRLVIVKATGKLGAQSGDGSAPATDTADLPTGTVVDLEKLAAREGVTVEVLTDDPDVTRDVLKRTHEDLRTPAGEKEGSP